jgi:hypothetical protein
MLIAGSTAAIALTSIVLLEGPSRMGTRYSAYGPPSGEPSPLVTFDGARYKLTDPPQYSITTTIPESIRGQVQPVIDHVPLESSLRLDSTPDLRGLAQAISLYSEASNLRTHDDKSSIIRAMLRYQRDMFYGENEAAPHQIEELAAWFGIQYVVLHDELDDLGKYPRETWPLVYGEEASETGVMQIRRFEAAPPLASHVRSPRILVIGGDQDAVYDQVFRTFVDIGFGFEQGLVVEGSHKVDDYGLVELLRFDVVLLHGYGYNNRTRAWQLLEQYVGLGGALFVDTGWQFRSPDWEMEEAPELLPFASLIWTDYGTEAEFALAESGLDLSVETELFAPLIWDDGPWGISSPTGDLRTWAQPVLTAGGNPIIVAGDYGYGRVVWSGMNLIGHAHAFENLAEKELLGELIRWLDPPPDTAVLEAPTFERAHPDRIHFTIDEPFSYDTSLLWREAYSPDWRASIDIGGQIQDVPIYSAGPGMMLLILPPSDSPSATVEMSFGFGWRGLAGIGISSLVGVALLASTALGGKLRSSSKGRLEEGKRRAEQPDLQEAAQPSGEESRSGEDAEKTEIEEALRSLNAKPEIDQGEEKAEQRWAEKVLGRQDKAKEESAGNDEEDQ